ncbi:DUF4062 domain-containing protein [Phenylobacterium sp.]|uniref:DUF4062 domain-containing protein n=1 Tax=Phenylobacterium sp. TaxID=1871053 RepID=UPI0026397252|nr:DUF4062 domain-containing protein [Phenylobacterium sp.]
MKVFLSSLIAGFSDMRGAGKAAIETLRHRPVMAEDFGAQPNSPQVACLQGLRDSDVVVLVLGEEYGAVQPTSGLSATHEEYREARGRKPVIAFVQEGIAPGEQQAAFIAEVQGWEGGLFRGSFRDAGALQIGITRALHDFELANAVGPLDPQALVAKAITMVPGERRNNYSQATTLSVAVVGGPLRSILRPVEIESPDFVDAIHQSAMFGESRFFDRAKGVTSTIEEAALVVMQEHGAAVLVDEQGSIGIRVPAASSSDDQWGRGGLSVILEENIHAAIGTAMSYSGSLLERIDPTQRMTHVGIAARIEGAEHLSWRTRAEHAASPNSVSMAMNYGDDRPPVSLSRPRAALRLDHARLIEDILVPLRRQRQTR